MSFQDRLADDASTVFSGHKLFEQSITYTPVTGSPSTFFATVVDDFDLTDDGSLDKDFIDGLAHVIQVYVPENDISQPVQNDEITYRSDTFRVYQTRYMMGMWHLLCTGDQRIRY